MKIKNLPDKLIWAAIILYAAFFSYISILKYQNFIYNDFDLAIDAQSLWNIIHGSLYSSIHQMVFLGNHMRIILFLIVPFYAIFPSPILLLLIQSIFLGLAAYPLYKITKSILDVKFALAIAFSYLSYPALIYMNLFEFHPTALATCFLMFMLYYFYRGNFLKFIIFAVLALSCQENIALLLITTGCYAFFVKKSKKWAFVPVTIGAVYFYISIFKIMPYFNNCTIDFWGLYNHLGSSPLQAIVDIVSNPLKTFYIMFSPDNLLLLFQLFAPLIFLPLFFLPLLAVALPIFMQHMLSCRFMERTIFYHYSAELIPFIFMAAVYGMKRICAVLNDTSRRALLWAIVLAAVISSVHLGPLGTISEQVEAWNLLKDITLVKDSFIHQIPQDASVAATFEFLPKFSNRKDLYSFHHFYRGKSTLSKKKYNLPKRIDYALINFSDRHTFQDFRSPESDKKIKDFFARYRLKKIDHADNTVFYKSYSHAQ